MSESSFDSLLTEFTPAPQLAPAEQHPAPRAPAGTPAPGNNPDSLKKLIKDAETSDGIKLNEPSGDSAELLNAIADRLYAAAPGISPDITTIPPKPKIMLYDSDQPNAANALSKNKDAALIYVSWGTLSDPQAAEQIIAHEYGHQLIAANPQFLANYVPPNPKAVNADLKKQFINPKGIIFKDLVADMASPNPPFSLSNESGYYFYMQEMAADKAGVLLTRNPDAAVSNIVKTQQWKQTFIGNETQDRIDAASKDHTVSNKEKAAIKRDVIEHLRMGSVDDVMAPHPDNSVRMQAAAMEGEKLTGKKESLPKRIEHKVEEFLGIKGKPSDGHDSPPHHAAPDTDRPAPLSTPAAPKGQAVTPQQR